MSDSLSIPADWTFHASDVAQKFDRHVREQLPWYEIATAQIGVVARFFVPHGGLIYDVGCSTGNIGRELAPVIAARQATLIGIESSAEMAAAHSGPGTVVCADALGFDFEPFDLAVVFLTMMFMPVRQRLPWLRELIKRGKPGGAVIVVDKFFPPAGKSGEAIRAIRIAGKAATGTSSADIVAKELSLSGIQNPFERRAFETGAGHLGVPFLQFGEFVGYLFESETSG